MNFTHHFNSVFRLVEIFKIFKKNLWKLTFILVVSLHISCLNKKKYIVTLIFYPIFASLSIKVFKIWREYSRNLIFLFLLPLPSLEQNQKRIANQQILHVVLTTNAISWIWSSKRFKCRRKFCKRPASLPPRHTWMRKEKEEIGNHDTGPINSPHCSDRQ